MRSFTLPDGPIPVDTFLTLLKRNSLCSFYWVNGNEVGLHRTESHKTYAVVIRDEDVQLLDFTRGVNPFRAKSEIVHGRPDLVDVAEYLKVMQALMFHFKHNGLMRNPHVPARANLHRTAYEVMMICLKEYAMELAGINIYWKVDPKRTNKVQRLKKQVCEPALGISTIKLPLVFDYTKKIVVTEEVVHEAVFPDRDHPRRVEAIREIEEYNMGLEDFDAGSVEALEEKHYNVHKKLIYPRRKVVPGAHTRRTADATDRTTSRIKWRIKDSKEIKARKEQGYYQKSYTPKPSYYEYANPESHGIDPVDHTHVEVRKEYVEKIVRQTHNPTTQERWQIKANIEMSRVLEVGLIADYNQRLNQRVMGPKLFIRDQSRLDMPVRDKIRRLKYHVEDPRMGGTAVMKAKRQKRIRAVQARAKKARIEHADKVLPSALVEQYNVRLLFYTLHTLGLKKGVACLTHEQMLKCLEFSGRDLKLPSCNRQNNRIRFQKRDRIVARYYLKKFFSE